MSFERFCIYWLMFLLMLSTAVFAEPIYGYDILALAKQPKEVVALAEPGKALGVLQGTFGDVIPALEREIRKGNTYAFRAHLTNGTCFRNQNCEAGEPGATNYGVLKKRAIAFQQLTDRNPWTKCFLSPRLEHDEKKREVVNKWFSIIKEFAPSCTPVCSNFTGYCPGDVLSEKHGNDSTADIVSNDGKSLYDADTSKYWGHGKVLSLGWINRFNLRVSGEKEFIPPSKRTVKATKDDMLQINALMKPMAPIPPAPSICKKVIKLTPSNTLKSNSEDYNQGNPRDNKPVLLIKQKYQNGFGVLSPTGKKVACASNRYNLPPFENLNRYYLGECANKSNPKVLKEAGNEWVFYRNGGICYLGNAVRRLGTHR